MEQSQGKEKKKKERVIDIKQAKSDANILIKKKEIVEDIDRLSAAKTINPTLGIIDSGKGRAYQGSKPLDVIVLYKSLKIILLMFLRRYNNDP